MLRNEILFSAKKQWTIKPQKDMEELKSILLSERGQSEKDIYCMIPNIWLSRKVKTMETVKKFSGCQREWGRRGWQIGAAQGNFRGETFLYGTIMVSICQYILLKHLECIVPSLTPTVDWGLWVIIIY
jgi:hypothetical protein